MINSLVSVVVTCYNHEKYIVQCLESIFNQTYTNIELFVFNDGSVDNSGSIIECTLMRSPFSNTKFIQQENIGLVATRNKAFEYISGDYFLFVDSDNFLEQNYIYEMLNVAQVHSSEIVYPKVIDAETKKLILDARDFNLEQLYIENYIESCSLVRNHNDSNIKYDYYLNYKKLEDYDFFLNLIVNNNYSAHPCKTTHLNYRVLENSMSNRNDLRYYYEVYSYILSKYYLANPEFAKNAMRVNYLRLFDLVSGGMRTNLITIYFDNGEGFLEINKEQYPLNGQEIPIKINPQTKRIRIDLTEIPSDYELVQLKNNATGEIIEPESTNGFRKGDGFIFPLCDPQIVYNLEFYNQKDLTLKYIMHTDQNRLPDRVYKYIKELQIANDDLHKLNSRLTTIEKQYLLMLNSRRWTITTKIINFFRRKQ